MESKTPVIGKEDYAEPRCLLCEQPYGAEAEIKPVPQQRIVEKVDDLMSRRDYAGVERHLLYWLEEAKLGHDLKGQLLIRNELVGHYRKTGDREKAFANAGEALKLIDEIGFSGSISEGTACVNIATVYNAFGNNEKSLAVFERARAIYESVSSVRPDLLGGLYNNMALTEAALGRFNDAMLLYRKALDVMERVENGELEQAITFLNMANAAEGEKGEEAAAEEIEGYLDKAMELLNTEGIPRNGYYAFVCEKCAPTFGYYGFFLAEEELKERAREIYERA